MIRLTWVSRDGISHGVEICPTEFFAHVSRVYHENQGRVVTLRPQREQSLCGMVA